ncbi:MAG: class I SAM-dependent methyltransferase [Candidatus Latescibacterota bacterium]|nr:class I SAM-dependent methyltransferase [Candidatus Latescibacterota bacterium]
MPSQKADPYDNTLADGQIRSDTIVVTTSRSPDDVSVAHAREIAREITCVFKQRSGVSLEALRDSTGCEHVIVVTSDEVRLVSPERNFWFHPNMARARIEAMLRGEVDRLVALAELKIGDSFLDVTCGLGADAITAAHVVGETGRVLAVERSDVLSAIVRHGMKIYKHRTEGVESAMRQVEIFTGDSAQFLQGQSDRSWDVIYFDPMFEKTVEQSQGIDVVRALAWLGSPGIVEIKNARRVARRCVIMKDRIPGRKLHELGFEAVLKRGRICYGRIDV